MQPLFFRSCSLIRCIQPRNILTAHVIHTHVETETDTETDTYVQRERGRDRNGAHTISKLGKKRRESSKCNYYIISPIVMIKTIIIIMFIINVYDLCCIVNLYNT